MSLERALELAERGRGTTHPNPVVGAVVVRDGAVVGEGWHERAGGPHAEVVALEAAGERARGATLFVSLEPCSHHGRTPPCTDAVVAAGVARVVVAAGDPSSEVDGIETLREAGLRVDVAEGEIAFRARAQNEAWRTWIVEGRPFVTYKAAVTLDGRMTVPGERWVSGEEARRFVHELRAASDAVAVGMETAYTDRPQLNVRDVAVVRQPRRVAFGSRPLPEGVDLERLSDDIDAELRRLGAERVQSLLLEGGATVATAFLERDLVDKLLVFVSPKLSGSGPSLVGELARRPQLHRFESRRVGEDVLLSAYVHLP